MSAVEKVVLIRTGCAGRPQPYTPAVREEFQRVVESVSGCAVLQDEDCLKFRAPDESAAQKVDVALKGKFLGGVYMGIATP